MADSKLNSTTLNTEKATSTISQIPRNRGCHLFCMLILMIFICAMTGCVDLFDRPIHGEWSGQGLQVTLYDETGQSYQALGLNATEGSGMYQGRTPGQGPTIVIRTFWNRMIPYTEQYAGRLTVRGVLASRPVYAANGERISDDPMPRSRSAVSSIQLGSIKVVKP